MNNMITTQSIKGATRQNSICRIDWEIVVPRRQFSFAATLSACLKFILIVHVDKSKSRSSGSLQYFPTQNVYMTFWSAADNLWHTENLNWWLQIVGIKHQVEILWLSHQDWQCIIKCIHKSWWHFILFVLVKMIAVKKNRNKLRIWWQHSKFV